MEPKITAPNHGPERSDIFSRGLEQAPAVPNPEVGVVRNIERHEQKATQYADALQATPVLPQPFTAQQPPVIGDDISKAGIAAAPLVANDDDLIEQEWVKRAKAIIAETKDDPYRRELEVGRLQADYLQKRYGKELSPPL